MGKIIGHNYFPEHGKINASEDLETIVKIDQGEFGEGVVLLPSNKNDRNLEISEIYEFQDDVIRIIDNIINIGIDDYIIVSEGKKDLDEALKEQAIRGLLIKTIDIWNEMYLVAQTITNTINFVEKDNIDVEFSDNYTLQAIEEILEPYKQKVFRLLFKKIKGKKDKK